jgi:hypothetical protein
MDSPAYNFFILADKIIGASVGFSVLGVKK